MYIIVHVFLQEKPVHLFIICLFFCLVFFFFLSCIESCELIALIPIDVSRFVGHLGGMFWRLTCLRIANHVFCFPGDSSALRPIALLVIRDLSLKVKPVAGNLQPG